MKHRSIHLRLKRKKKILKSNDRQTTGDLRPLTSYKQEKTDPRNAMKSNVLYQSF